MDHRHIKRHLPFFIGCVLLVSTAWSQNATVRGIILNEDDNPIPDVNVAVGSLGTQSNENGFYALQIPANQEVTLVFSHITYKLVTMTLNLGDGEQYELNPVMSLNIEQFGEVVVSAQRRKEVQGVISIPPKTIRLIPGANAGVENILKTLPGVSSNNELSTQYSVRGGNYDENLVYVNEIEVYRPFLVRSGQQEGLSFINTDMIQNVDFSAGGFRARYGDKLSSVLDITYRTPVSFGAGIQASLLGVNMYLEGITPDRKFSALGGARYWDNGIFVNSQDTETNYQPRFVDVQVFLTYHFSKKFNMNFLGTISQNDYDFEPLTRRANFGTLQNPIAVLVEYEGQEEDEYHTYFGALKVNYCPTENLVLKLVGSAYHTTEQEYFDILAEYSIGDVNTAIGDDDFGDIEFPQAIGSQRTHARNDLDAFIVNLEHLGSYQHDSDIIDWGVKYTREDTRDRQVEWEVIDSAGFSIRPPFPEFNNDQPYEPFEAPLEAFQSVRGRNDVVTDRFSGFLQWSRRGFIGENEIWYNLGIRAQHWQVGGRDVLNDEDLETNAQTIISPRGQFAIKPNWEKDMLFRIAAGIYSQPPFYRELRDSLGRVNTDVKAQRSFHVVLGNDYSFKMWGRPFKLISEAYYKGLTDVNPYTLENVRIRYRARNNAVAYAYGMDFRLNGEFVPGTESWFSFGYLKTEENIDDRGYIARPTDQRLKFGVLFQDYMPNLPEMRVYLNLIYNTGLPGGSPSYADPYEFQSRLPDYRRADVGISYVFTDGKKRYPKGHWLHVFQELFVGFEIFNIFDNQNSITNTWLRDASSQRQFAIPNYMTGRVFNVKFGMRF